MSLLSTPTNILPAPSGLVGRYYGQPGSLATYYYWVQAVYIGGTSPLSNATAAIAVAGLDQNNFIALNWNAMAGALAYNIFRSTTSTAPTSGTNYLTTVSAPGNFNDKGTFAVSSSFIARNGVFMARAYYDTNTDAVAAGAIIPAQSDTIPAGALVINGVLNSTVALTSGGSATIGVGTSAGSSATSIKGQTAVASYSLDAALVTLASTAPFKMSAAGQIQITVATADLLRAGVLEVIMLYVFPVNL